MGDGTTEGLAVTVRAISLLASAALLVQSGAAAAMPFFNEFHYDNVGIDAGEFIELAGPAGFDLTGWQIARYNGSGGTRYTSPGADPVLAGLSFANQSNGFGFLAFDYPANGLQNGNPDGLALVRPDSSVAQFLSYGGSFTAVDGPAAGLTSVDIGRTEPGNTPLGQSLQLTGTGTQPNFTWTGPIAATRGLVNTGQVFDTDVPPPPPPPPPGVSDRTIAEIQGAAQSSPLVGQAVRTTGVVTQLASNGYYLLSNTPDASAATSEGLFVFTGGAPAVAVGDLVSVQGNVGEFLPGGNATNLTVTQLSGTSNLTVLSMGNSVSATLIGAGGRTPPTQAIENDPAVFDPAVSGRDFYESLEGMLITVAGATAVGPTIQFSNGNREIYVRSNAPVTGLNSRGGLTITENDFNPERIQIDPVGNVGPAVDTGAQLGDVTGVLSYNFGNFELLPATAPTVVANPPARETTTLDVGGNRLNIATYNVLNLASTETARFGDLAQQVIGNLKSPEIIGFQELINDNPAATLEGVADAIRAAGGPSYAVGFVPRGEGATTDDRIVNGFLYDTARVTLVPGSLGYAPGSETDAAFSDSRAPLVGTFVFNGRRVTVINNHFSSRGGSNPLFGSVQPPANGSESRRQAQGEFINAYVDTLLGSNPNALISVLGDLNSFYFENPQLALQGLPGDAVLFGLHELLELTERYSFIFDGNSQLLDYIYASQGLFGLDPRFNIVHFNSDFFGAFSDHEPLIASFLIERVAEPKAALLLLVGLGALAVRRRREGARR